MGVNGCGNGGEVVSLIRAARQRAAQVVNTEVIDLYWRIGQYLHHKIEADGWAKGTVVQLAAYVAQREPGKLGFSSQNLWRMRQIFEAYPVATKLSTLVRVLPWPRPNAIPPLGCGNGGLSWVDGRPLIEAAFEPLPEVEVLLFEPTDSAQGLVARARSRSGLTEAQALDEADRPVAAVRRMP